jgi:hypothetical protein
VAVLCRLERDAFRSPALGAALGDDVAGLVQYLSNEVAFCTLSMIHPITYALANTFKRSIVVVASLIFFRQSLPPVGAAGAAMALLGALGYSLAMERERQRQRAATKA